MGNGTFGHTPQFNALASNGHALTGPQAANDHAEKNTQTPSNAQVITDLTKRASTDTAQAKHDFRWVQRYSAHASDAEKKAQIDRLAGDRLGAIQEDQLAAQDKAAAKQSTKDGDKELKAAEIDTTAANGLANKGSSNNKPSGGAGNGTGTGGKGGGTGGNTNANNGNTTTAGGNQPHPATGGRPFPGQFPGMIGMGHGPFVVGPFVGGPVAVGGSVAPVAVAPVASAGGALPPVTAPSAPRPLAPSCLKKTYLQTGMVMFRDVCSQEWAINSSNVTNPAPTKRACLSKENPQDGVVLFKDNCTSEWAMNPQQPDNQAQAN